MKKSVRYFSFFIILFISFILKSNASEFKIDVELFYGRSTVFINSQSYSGLNCNGNGLNIVTISKKNVGSSYYYSATIKSGASYVEKETTTCTYSRGEVKVVFHINEPSKESYSYDIGLIIGKNRSSNPDAIYSLSGFLSDFNNNYSAITIVKDDKKADLVIVKTNVIFGVKPSEVTNGEFTIKYINSGGAERYVRFAIKVVPDDGDTYAYDGEIGSCTFASPWNQISDLIWGTQKKDDTKLPSCNSNNALLEYAGWKSQSVPANAGLQLVMFTPTTEQCENYKKEGSLISESVSIGNNNDHYYFSCYIRKKSVVINTLGGTLKSTSNFNKITTDTYISSITSGTIVLPDVDPPKNRKFVGWMATSGGEMVEAGNSVPIEAITYVAQYSADLSSDNGSHKFYVDIYKGKTEPLTVSGKTINKCSVSPSGNSADYVSAQFSNGKCVVTAKKVTSSSKAMVDLYADGETMAYTFYITVLDVPFTTTAGVITGSSSTSAFGSNINFHVSKKNIDNVKFAYVSGSSGSLSEENGINFYTAQNDSTGESYDLLCLDMNRDGPGRSHDTSVNYTLTNISNDTTWKYFSNISAKLLSETGHSFNKTEYAAANVALRLLSVATGYNQPTNFGMAYYSYDESKYFRYVDPTADSRSYFYTKHREQYYGGSGSNDYPTHFNEHLKFYQWLAVKVFCSAGAGGKDCDFVDSNKEPNENNVASNPFYMLRKDGYSAPPSINANNFDVVNQQLRLDLSKIKKNNIKVKDISINFTYNKSGDATYYFYNTSDLANKIEKYLKAAFTDSSSQTGSITLNKTEESTNWSNGFSYHQVGTIVFPSGVTGVNKTYDCDDKQGFSTCRLIVNSCSGSSCSYDIRIEKSNPIPSTLGTFRFTFDFTDPNTASIYLLTPSSSYSGIHEYLKNYQRMILFDNGYGNAYIEVKPSGSFSCDISTPLLNYKNCTNDNNCKTDANGYTSDGFNPEIFINYGCCKFVTDQNSYFYRNYCESNCAISTFSSACTYGAAEQSGTNIDGTYKYIVREGEGALLGYKCLVDITNPHKTDVDNLKNSDTKVDNAGNKYVLSSYSNSLNPNPYCRVSCKENWDFYLPSFESLTGNNAVNAGQAFWMKNPAHIEATKTCVSTYIDVEKFEDDLRRINNENLDGEVSLFNNAINHMAACQNFILTDNTNSISDNYTISSAAQSEVHIDQLKKYIPSNLDPNIKYSYQEDYYQKILDDNNTNKLVDDVEKNGSGSKYSLSKSYYMIVDKQYSGYNITNPSTIIMNVKVGNNKNVKVYYYDTFRYYKSSITYKNNYRTQGLWYYNLFGGKRYATSSLANTNEFNKTVTSEHWNVYINKKNIFPVSINTPRNLYQYVFTFEDVGNYNDGSKGRIMGKNNMSIIPVNTYECFYEVYESFCKCCGSNNYIDAYIGDEKKLNGAAYTTKEYVSIYNPNVKASHVVSGSTNKGKATYSVSTIDLYDIDTESDRAIGDNWNGAASQTVVLPDGSVLVSDWSGSLLKKDIEYRGEHIYNQTPEYSYVLTPSAIQTIKQYNDNHSYTITDKDMVFFGKTYYLKSDRVSLLGKNDRTSNNQNDNKVIGFSHYGSSFLKEKLKDYRNSQYSNLFDTRNEKNGVICEVKHQDYMSTVENLSSSTSNDYRSSIEKILGDKYKKCRWVDFQASNGNTIPFK